MNSITMEKLPLQRRKGFGYTLLSPIRALEERKEGGIKNYKQDIFPQMKQNPAMPDTNSEKNRNDPVGRTKMEIIVNPKPQSYKMPFDANNCYTDYDYSSLDSFKEQLKDNKQTGNRRQEKSDTRKLEDFGINFNDIHRERCETNSKLLNGYEISNMGRLYENELRMTKEIHKKEMLLQKKLLKAVETLEKVQIGSEAKEKKKQEQRNTRRSEIKLYDAEKGNLDWKKDKILRGRRHEQQEELNHLLKKKDSLKREENGMRDTNFYQEKKINVQRTTRTAETELGYFEKMTRQMRKPEQTEKVSLRKEQAVEWHGSEKWDLSNWQEKERLKAYNGGKRRRDRVNLKKHTDKEDEYQCWNKMETMASNSPIREKDIFKHDKWDLLIKNNMAAQDRMHRFNNKAAEEMPFKQPLPNGGPTIQNAESLQQVNLIPENSSDFNFQLLPCELCHRKFKEDRLEKHISICQKIQKPKCKVYDSSMYRIKGTELEEFIKKNGRSKTPEPKKNKKQDAFIQNIRQARHAKDLQAREDPYSDYVTCPHCSRRFAPGPAETHIPKCKNIKSRPPPPRQRHQM